MVYSYCTRHKRNLARECQFSGKRVWAMPWGFVGAAQLLGPYVAIPGSRQSDDVAARLCKWTDAVPRRGLGCMRESHRRSARAAAEGLVCDWDGDLFGSPRLVGAKQAASPQSRLLGAPPLTTMRASRAFRLFDCVFGSRDSGRPWSYWARAVLLALSCFPRKA